MKSTVYMIRRLLSDSLSIKIDANFHAVIQNTTAMIESTTLSDGVNNVDISIAFQFQDRLKRR